MYSTWIKAIFEAAAVNILPVCLGDARRDSFLLMEGLLSGLCTGRLRSETYFLLALLNHLPELASPTDGSSAPVTFPHNLMSEFPYLIFVQL